MRTNLLEFSIGRDFGLFYNWKPFLRTNLLEFSIGRDFGLLHNWKPFLGKKIFELSIGRDFGALKGLTHYRLSVVLGFANRTLMTTGSRACSSDCHVSFYPASDLILGVI